MKDQEIFNRKCRNFWIEAIEQWVHNETDRKMLVRRHLDGIVLEPLSVEFNMTANNCDKRIKNAKEQLFKHVDIEKLLREIEKID